MTKFATAALATLTLGGSLLAAAAPAQAYYYKPWKPYYGPGPVAAGVIGGLALGAVAASAAASSGYGYGGCYITRREVVDVYGNVYLRRVRVCE